MKVRKLTVYEGVGKNYVSIPKIILQGQWLQRLGFSVGDKVNITFQQDQLIITKFQKREQE